jgi:putative transposase
VANTYTQIYIQMVFAPYGRTNLIPTRHREEIYKYITGIVGNQRCKMICIGGMPDHLHILVGLHPATAISGLVREVKSESSLLINSRRWVHGKFAWQEGYGAFSYGRSQLSALITYIQRQEEHHRRQSFRGEYLSLLRKFRVEYDEQYLFEWTE